MANEICFRMSTKSGMHIFGTEFLLEERIWILQRVDFVKCFSATIANGNLFIKCH